MRISSDPHGPPRLGLAKNKLKTQGFKRQKNMKKKFVFHLVIETREEEKKILPDSA